MPISTPLRMLEAACLWPRGGLVCLPEETNPHYSSGLLVLILDSLKHIWVTIWHVVAICRRHSLQTPSKLKLVSRLSRTVLGKATHWGSCHSQDMINLVIILVYYVVFAKGTTFSQWNVSSLNKDVPGFEKPHGFSGFSLSSLGMAQQLGWMCFGF